MWTIVLVVYDPLDKFSASGVISRCLSSIKRLEGDYELVVVNNNPLQNAPALTQTLREYATTGVTIVEPNASLGSSGGFNLGLKSSAANSDYAAFMSVDAEIIDEHMLNRLEATFRNFPRAGVLHPISIYEDLSVFNLSKQFHATRYFARVQQKAAIDSEETFQQVKAGMLAARSSAPNFSGPQRSFPLTFAAIRRSAIDTIGNFDEGVKGCCCENDDFAFRCQRGGFSVGKAENTSIYHHRYLFYRLTHHDSVVHLPHADEIGQAHDWWVRKWGAPYAELHFEWRWGKTLSALAKPYFACRSLAGKLKRKIYES